MASRSVILGIAAYYHDSAAALLVDGKLVAAAQEERFTRIKHDPGFPANAVRYVLEEAGLAAGDITEIAFYDKPYIKFERLLETYHVFAPHGLRSFITAIPVWIKEKLFLKRLLRTELNAIAPGKYSLNFPEHHLSHAASAFFPSPFNKAAILTIDGVGEWATTSLGLGDGNSITSLKEIHFPHSLGLLYSAFTFYCGFKVNSGEYKLMGLAPYGDATSAQTAQFIEHILSELVDVREDGSFVLNMAYFNYPTGLTMTKDKQWQALFGLPRLEAETELTQPYMNLALAVQSVTEQIVIKLARTACEAAGSRNLVMAGGVALNCVANGKLLYEAGIDNLWIQPAAGDAGGAVGAAQAQWHIAQNEPRNVTAGPAAGAAEDGMQGSYLGPAYERDDIQQVNARYQAIAEEQETLEQTCQLASDALDNGMVVGWFQGRMEFGPRALCNRSILGDARNPAMQKKINLNIKYREGFRPFAPVVLEEDANRYFDISTPSPYMLLVAPVQQALRKALPEDYATLPMYDRLYIERSSIPAVTHVDYSARIQTISRSTNEQMHQLLTTFKQRTGCAVLVNTSFNVRGEPIVCTPDDAYRCFMQTEMDMLVIGNTIYHKSAQPQWQGKRDVFAPD